MSFLPYGNTSPLAWGAAMGGSAVVHGGIVLLALSASITFLPPPERGADSRQAAFDVTLEILDAGPINVPEPVPLPMDAPAEMETELLPEESPEAPLLEAAPPPEDIAPELPPEVTEDVAPVALDNDPTPEAEALPPETAPAEIVETPLPEAPPLPEERMETPVEAAEGLPDPAPMLTPEPVAPLTEPIAPSEYAPASADISEPTPVVEAPMVVEEQLMIEDTTMIAPDVINPLAVGGAGGAEPAPLLPEPLAEVPVAPEPEVLLETIVSEPVIPPPSTIPQPIVPDGTADPMELAMVAPQVPDAPSLTPVTPEPVPEVEETPVALPPDAPEADTAPADGAGTATAPRRIENPTATDLQLGQLLRNIRNAPAPQCALALPRRLADGGLALSMIGADLGTLDGLATQATAGLDPLPVANREVVDTRQCAALDALRISQSYPASRIGLSLDRVQLSSGENLTGRVLGSDGLFLSLLLVDDNGVVQDLSRFTDLSPDGTLSFDVPVARAGPTRATRQLLIVLGTPDGPLDLSAGFDRLSQDSFTTVDASALEAALFGVASFDVR